MENTFLEVDSEDEFWQDIQVVFGPIAGSTLINHRGIRRKVMNLDRKATFHARVRFTGIAVPAPTDFEQELDI